MKRGKIFLNYVREFHMHRIYLDMLYLPKAIQDLSMVLLGVVSCFSRNAHIGLGALLYGSLNILQGYLVWTIHFRGQLIL